jgi:Tol biopolymer transport system component
MTSPPGREEPGRASQDRGLGERRSPSLRRDVAAIPRSRPVRRFGRGRGVTLLAAAALLLVGGTVAAGSGLLRLPSLVPPEPVPTLAVALTPSPAPSATSPASSPSPVATPQPAAVIAYINYAYGTNRMAQPGRVWIVGTDGTGAHELFPVAMGAQSGVAWSPDGTKLVYGERDLVNGGTHLYLTDATGSAPQAVDLSCGTGCYVTAPSFSSDGTKLVFLRADGSTAAPRLAILDIASGRVVELTSPTSTPVIVGERPRLSPDGTKIVFSRLDKFGNGSAVFIVDADGTNLHQLSAASLPARLPNWSPDGSRIVFTSLVRTYVQQGGTTLRKLSQDVYTVRPDWTDLRRLTNDGNSIGATWTPDGRILFATGCKGNCVASGGLWTMNADGSNAKLLVPGGSGVDAPFWGVDAAWQPTP